jgi:hypothetical protein
MLAQKDGDFSNDCDRTRHYSPALWDLCPATIDA